MVNKEDLSHTLKMQLNYYLVQNCDNSETFNVGNNKTSSLNEVIKIIEKFSNKEARVNNQPRAFRDPDVVLPSLSKSKQILDWEPSTNIEEGIKSTIEWYSSFQDKINQEVQHQDL